MSQLKKQNKTVRAIIGCRTESRRVGGIFFWTTSGGKDVFKSQYTGLMKQLEKEDIFLVGKMVQGVFLEGEVLCMSEFVEQVKCVPLSPQNFVFYHLR